MVDIKDLINPGSKQDNEVLYGSGRNNDPFHDGTTSSTDPLSTSTSTNPHSSIDPLAPSTSTHHPHTSTSADPTSTSDVGGRHHHGVNEKPFGSHSLGTTEPSSITRAPPTLDDAATTASIKSGVPGNAQGGSLTHSSDTHDTLQGSKRLPNQPTTTGLNDPYGTTTTAGPHSSDLANRADPRVDSDLDGRKGLEADRTGTGAGLTGSSLPDRSVGGSGLSRESHTSDPTHLGRDTAIGAGALGAGVLGTDAAAHHHQHPPTQENAGPLSGYHKPTTSSASGLGPGPAGTIGGTSTGPRSSGLAANRADSRVDSDLGGPAGVGNTGYGLGTGNTVGYGHQGSHERDGGLLGATGTAGHRHEDRHEGHSLGKGESAAGLHLTSGPHVTDTANRLDPHVDGTRGPLETLDVTDNGSGRGLGTRTDVDTKGAAYVSGTGSSRDPGTTTDSKSSTTGPHKFSILNKLDPRVHSDPKPTTTNAPSSTDPSHSDKDHHYGRDAGLAGAGGVAAYEAEKHHGHHGLTAKTDTSAYPTPGNETTNRHSGKDHHYGRDAGLVGTGGVAAYEAEKHHGHHGPTAKTDPSAYPTSGNKNTDRHSGKDHHYGRDEGLAGAGGVAAYEAEKHHDYHKPTAKTGTSAYPTFNHDRLERQSGKDHQYGRDAGLAGAGGVAAYEAEKHHGRHEPTSKTDSSAYPTSGPETADRHLAKDHHYARNAGLAGAGGAAAYEAEKHHGHHEPTSKADPSTNPTSGRDITNPHTGHPIEGTAAATGAEFSKKEAENLERDHRKEIKVHEKEEKKYEKALEKEEKKHEDGKKHGGILGLFHRDKSDKGEKDTEPEHRGTHEAEAAVGVGAVGAGLTDHEKSERKRLHKDPPAGYGPVPTSGYSTQVTGGTGTTALAQGEESNRGPHLTQLGDKLDPNVPPRGGLLQHDETIEPHTGLPIDLSKGSGEGGIDESSAPGYHTHDGGVIGGTAGTTGTAGPTGTAEYGSGRDGYAGHHGHGVDGRAL